MLVVIHRVGIEYLRRISVAAFGGCMPPDFTAKDFAFLGAPRAGGDGVAHGTQ